MHGFGNMLKDYLNYYNISQTDFAERLGITQKHMNGILNENTGLSNDLILAISLLTDIDPKLILLSENKRKMYNYLNNKFKNENEIEKFLNNFYINDLVKMKWITLKDKNSYVQKAIDLLDYLKVRDFDVFSSYMNNRVLFKKKEDSNNIKTYLWIKMCDEISKKQKVSIYNKSNISKLLSELDIERNKKVDIESLIFLFNKNGIYLVVLDAIKGTKVRGCSMVKNTNPAIYITKYNKEKSSFYYALYHEISHIVSDYNKAKNKIIIDEDLSKQEEKADKYALNCMIKEEIWNEIINNYEDREIICKNNKIPLSFLYSRLAYEKIIDYNDINYIKNRETI
jgi:plasmid maintenance system antidote protein VapI